MATLGTKRLSFARAQPVSQSENGYILVRHQTDHEIVRNGCLLPTISIVTPSYNCKNHLRFTIDSVAASKYPALEYGVVDGGSDDGTAEMLECMHPGPSWWLSESDGGHYDAVNKGFARMSGEIMGWLNAGDALFPDAIRIVAQIFSKFPEIQWITSRIISQIDDEGRCVIQHIHPGFSRNAFMRGENIYGEKWYSTGFVQQESTFWRRQLWEKAGRTINCRYRFAADFELWVRFFRHADLYAVSAPLGGFRRHRGQLSEVFIDEYRQECISALRASGGIPRGRLTSAACVGLRLFSPAPVRPLLHRLGLVPPAKVVSYDFRIGDWKLAMF